MTVLALERYLIISRPLSGGHLSWGGAVFCVLAIWIYSAALTTPPLFGWGEYGYEAANIR